MDSKLHINHLIAHINKEVSLSLKEEARISEMLRVRKIEKKECLIEPGMSSKYMNFISLGCMRAYYIDPMGQEHTLQLGVENWWINDLYGYITEQPSKMYVQAIEPSVIVQISKSDLNDLYLEIPAISIFFLEKIQNAYVALQERTLENMSSDSFERYLRFLKQYRNIEQRVPQYVVASYLGITPEFLSYLRKKHAKDLS